MWEVLSQEGENFSHLDSRTPSIITNMLFLYSSPPLDQLRDLLNITSKERWTASSTEDLKDLVEEFGV
jgi:hypothetical protein